MVCYGIVYYSIDNVADVLKHRKHDQALPPALVFAISPSPIPNSYTYGDLAIMSPSMNSEKPFNCLTHTLPEW